MLAVLAVLTTGEVTEQDRHFLLYQLSVVGVVDHTKVRVGMVLQEVVVAALAAMTLSLTPEARVQLAKDFLGVTVRLVRHTKVVAVVALEQQERADHWVAQVAQD